MTRTSRRSVLSRFLWLGAPAALAAPVLAAVTASPPQAPAGNPMQLRAGPGSVARGAQLSATCQGCHGAGGVSRNPKVPGLAGQVPSYLQLQLAAFRAKLRPSPVMQGVAAKLTDQNIVDLAAYFSSKAPGPAWKPASTAARQQGEKLFQGGDAARNVMACAVCHGANGRGVGGNGIASVTNLSPEYAVAVLHEFRDAKTFGGIIHPEAMRIALRPLTDAELQALAAYVSSMK